MCVGNDRYKCVMGSAILATEPGPNSGEMLFAYPSTSVSTDTQSEMMKVRFSVLFNECVRAAFCNSFLGVRVRFGLGANFKLIVMFCVPGPQSRSSSEFTSARRFTNATNLSCSKTCPLSRWSMSSRSQRSTMLLTMAFRCLKKPKMLLVITLMTSRKSEMMSLLQLQKMTLWVVVHPT